MFFYRERTGIQRMSEDANSRYDTSPKTSDGKCNELCDEATHYYSWVSEVEELVYTGE